jgi:integrase/recombinase XerD
MTFTKLSGYLNQFFATQRTMAEADPHFDAFHRRLLRYKQKLLRNFLAFWKQQGCPWPIRTQTVLDWITASSHPEHPYRDQHHFYILRAFLKQLRTFEPETEVPESPLYFRRPRRLPYIFSEHELSCLMRATKRLRLFDSFRVSTIRTLIGLLASAGLRIGEALRLELEDVKLTTSPPYLVIRDTKFGKSRNVVLHPTATDHLRKYLCERTKVLGAKRVDVFLTNRMGKRLNYSSQRLMFGRLLRRAGIRATAGQRRPSLHSFRHSFAVRRLTHWHRDRRNVQELLPHLSVYLGHIGPASTYWYLTATPELLQAAARSFERQQSQGAALK